MRNYLIYQIKFLYNFIKNFIIVTNRRIYKGCIILSFILNNYKVVFKKWQKKE